MSYHGWYITDLAHEVSRCFEISAVTLYLELNGFDGYRRLRDTFGGLSSGLRLVLKWADEQDISFMIGIRGASPFDTGRYHLNVPDAFEKSASEIVPKLLQSTDRFLRRVIKHLRLDDNPYSVPSWYWAKEVLEQQRAEPIPQDLMEQENEVRKYLSMLESL